MTAKNIQTLEGILDTLEMLDFTDQAKALRKIIESERPKPKAPAEKPIKATVTTGTNTVEMEFKNTREYEKWAKDMVKTREKLINKWQAENNCRPPDRNKLYFHREDSLRQYNTLKEEYLHKLKNANLNFEIVVRQC